MGIVNEEMIRKIFKLRKNGGTFKGIARSLGIDRNTARKYIRLKEGYQENRNKIALTKSQQNIKPPKKLLKKSMSRHLNNYRNSIERVKTEYEMAGNRLFFCLEKYCEIYKLSTKFEKSKLLDEVCRITNYHRKYAIKLLLKGKSSVIQRRKRKKSYSDEVLYVIERIWEAADYPWSERLIALLPMWLPWAKTHMKWITPEIEVQITSISARQIDRRLKDKKKKLSRKIYGRTKPGKLLKQHIPIKIDAWNIFEPGYTEIDLVSHSGTNSSGDFIHSLNITDIYSGWVETTPIFGKSELVTLKAIKEIKRELPFILKGIDSDNGTEFVNNLLFNYCKDNDIQFTRSRPYKKDDNAHVEQKNWTHVRRIMGYERYDTVTELNMIKELYRKKLRLMMNLFQPCVKLVSKEKIGSKTKRKYDTPQTPLDRLVNFYNQGNKPIPINIVKFIAQRNEIDPFRLSDDIEKMLVIIKSFRNKSRRIAV